MKKKQLMNLDSGYTEPIAFLLPSSQWPGPDLSLLDRRGAPIIAFDLETRDPNLLTLGPGDIRGDGFVLGVSIAFDDGASTYFPLRHRFMDNVEDISAVQGKLKTILEDPKTIKVGSNLLYDIGWLRTIGINAVGPFYDTTYAEALLDEEAPSVGLDAAAMKYLGIRKDDEMLIQAATAYGVAPDNKSVKASLWALPAKFVGPYAIRDAELAIKIWEKQSEAIRAEELEGVLAMEHALLPLFSEMRRRGVKLDLAAGEELLYRIKATEKQQQEKIDHQWNNGFHINVLSSEELATICRRNEIEYGLTKKGNPSFNKESMAMFDHPFFHQVKELRLTQKIRKDFVEKLLGPHNVRGRVHALFHQLKGDESGTRTGRCSSSDPNMQQIPARSIWGPQVRALFIPDEGYQWGKFDYSQQEPRLMVHYGCKMGIRGAQAFADRYWKDNTTSFYKLIMDAAQVTKDVSKTLSLGRSYGMVAKTVAKQLKVSLDEACELLRRFDEAAPFIGRLAQITEEKAIKTGFIRTLSGRRRHYNKYVPKHDRRLSEEADQKEEHKPLPFKEAQEKWPGLALEAVGSRTAFNSLIQGGGADMNKMAMLNIWNKYGLVPLSCIHDELNYLIEKPEQQQQIEHEMVTAYQLLVPMRVESHVGGQW